MIKYISYSYVCFFNIKLAEDILKFIIFAYILDKIRWHKFIKRWNHFVFFEFGLNLAW